MGWGTLRGEAVEFRSCGTTIQAHVGRPAVPGRFPAVIILHGLPGLQPDLERAAERFGEYVERGNELSDSAAIVRLYDEERGRGRGRGMVRVE